MPSSDPKGSLNATRSESDFSTLNLRERFIQRLILDGKKSTATKIFDEKDNEIGKVTSGTFGPSVNASIAMGYISNSHSKTDTKVFLEVRGKKVPANVCDLPFYKKSYVKGEANV